MTDDCVRSGGNDDCRKSATRISDVKLDLY